MDKSFLKIILGILFICIVIGVVFVRSELHRTVDLGTPETSFTVEQGDSVQAIAERLKEQGIIHNTFFFRRYISWKNLDTQIQAGTYTLQSPFTLRSVIHVLRKPISGEREITIIPGWNIRDVAAYLEEEGVASQKEVFEFLGDPADEDTNPELRRDTPLLLEAKPAHLSFEGYLRPDTFRFFTSATAEDILSRLAEEREKEFTPELVVDITKAGRTIHEVLTIASLLEREVRHAEDQAKVADIFWRRADNGWPLQADSTVHYITGKKGDVFTTPKDRDNDSPWNTYKYPGLPPGPIAIPSIASIRAAVYPEENPYWYFLTTLDTGEVKYARTLEEHNRNVAEYLR